MAGFLHMWLSLIAAALLAAAFKESFAD